MFSIILPTYNRSSTIVAAIDSVIGQEYTDWELVIVDDGSTDNTKKIIETYLDNRIKYVFQENQERSAARNNGIINSSRSWICFLDSDDVYAPDHLSVLQNFIQQNNIVNGLVSTGILRISESLNQQKEFLNLDENPLTEICEKFLIPTQICVHQSILETEKFDVRFRIWEDTHLWLRIAAQYPIYQIKKYTTIQNIHSKGTVVQGMLNITLRDVHQYITAINDFKKNHYTIFRNKLEPNYFDNYVLEKLKMYLYQARQNRQLLVAIKIWFIAVAQKPSFYLFREFPKIFINKINIGIHKKKEG